MSEMTKARVGVREMFGLRPLRPALAGCWRAIAGDGAMPASRFDLSSTRIFKPRISLATWLRVQRQDRRALIYNLFNRRLPPQGTVHSVRVTDCEDFRGRQLTYDGHVGTDFALPVGTPITAAAAGRVLRVRNDMDRGGLKVLLDHGGGLMTCSCHLARVMVPEGACVERGQVIALSGASGVDVLLCFPWVAPHLHLTVFIDGAAVDPYARDGEVSLWRQRNDPMPAPEGAWHLNNPATSQNISDAPDLDSRWAYTTHRDAIDACRDPRERARLHGIADERERAIELFLARAFRAPLFEAFPTLFEEVKERRPLLDLPLRAVDYIGARFPDEPESD